MNDLLSHLTALYGEEEAPALVEQFQNLIARYRLCIHPSTQPLTERDVLLITYADQVQAAHEKPLNTLNTFCTRYLSDVISGIHILPFYPWSSDDGFSVVDYRQVDPAFGDWNDIAAFSKQFRLMFDGVINHISAQSTWFQGFLRDDLDYREFFIVVDGTPDLSQVVRPRALPLLTTFNTPSGAKHVWTTFSADQIDLNYKNPAVLLEILDILLMYIERGATFIRLDAIAYLWKEIGTACLHLPQTHRIIRLLRAVFDEVVPQVQLITETNVPHQDNISYFGDGHNEAQLVYNFALPPLVLHAFRTGQVSELTHWAESLTRPSQQNTFFNFLASHDGIGLNPVRNILSEDEIKALINQTLAHGGLVSYKHNPDGSQSPYELNINYFDALSDPNGNETLDLQVNRFMAAQAILLALQGIPGIYFHSLFGSRSWRAGAEQTGQKRTINRAKCQLDELNQDLADLNSLRVRVFFRYRQLLLARKYSPAFHPLGGQTILEVHPSVFALERFSPDFDSHVLCFHNVSAHKVSFATPYATGTNMLTGQIVSLSEITLAAYRVLWVKL